MAARSTALVFDLDGTLVDSVYQHVLAWHGRCSRPASSCRSGASIAGSG